jgi:hypothetical protein
MAPSLVIRPRGGGRCGWKAADDTDGLPAPRTSLFASEISEAAAAASFPSLAGGLQAALPGDARVAPAPPPSTTNSERKRTWMKSVNRSKTTGADILSSHGDSESLGGTKHRVRFRSRDNGDSSKINGDSSSNGSARPSSARVDTYKADLVYVLYFLQGGVAVFQIYIIPFQMCMVPRPLIRFNAIYASNYVVDAISVMVLVRARRAAPVRASPPARSRARRPVVRVAGVLPLHSARLLCARYRARTRAQGIQMRWAAQWISCSRTLLSNFEFRVSLVRFVFALPVDALLWATPHYDAVPYVRLIHLLGAVEHFGKLIHQLQRTPTVSYNQARVFLLILFIMTAMRAPRCRNQPALPHAA